LQRLSTRKVLRSNRKLGSRAARSLILREITFEEYDPAAACKALESYAVAAFLDDPVGLGVFVRRAVMSACARFGARDGLATIVAGAAVVDLFTGFICTVSPLGRQAAAVMTFITRLPLHCKSIHACFGHLGEETAIGV
jgi:hypothetical protein